MLIGLSTLTILSCSEDPLTGSQEMQSPSTSGNVMTTAELDGSLLFNSQTHSEKDPQQNHKNFMEMLSTVENMERQEIENLTDEQLLELGKPVLDITENTVQLPPKLLLAIDNQLSALNLNMRELNEAQLESIKRRYQMALRENPNERPEIRKIKAKDIRGMLLDYYDSKHVDPITVSALSSDPTTLCSSMFNQIGNTVYLYPGDNLDTANRFCLQVPTFMLTQGTYYKQSVQGSYFNKSWAGIGTVVLDGKSQVDVAFDGGLTGNSISWIRINNYKQSGIFADGASDLSIHHMSFENIGYSANGEDWGAVRMEDCQNIRVTDSLIKNTSSGVLFTKCEGPLMVNDNEALNPGRNFFQCNDCQGGGIQINRNSLEHTTGYGDPQITDTELNITDTTLEDWINLYNSTGLEGDYIQVNNNRARTMLSNGRTIMESPTGCFILMGDAGGMYQSAEYNYGVNPGNCGIGVASGQFMRIKNNKMYSKAIQGLSNVAYYSMNLYSSRLCNNHYFFTGSDSNEANWTCGNSEHCNPPFENRAFANSTCKDQNGEEINTPILRNRIEQKNFGPEIWNQW